MKGQFAREEALSEVAPILEALDRAAIPYYIAGSIRRGRLEVGDVDIVVLEDDLSSIANDGLPVEVIAQGADKLSLDLSGLQIDLYYSQEDYLGAMLLFLTGSKGFNIYQRSLAKRKGFRLNQYGLWGRDRQTLIAARTEEEIFRALEMPFLPPVEREGHGINSRANLSAFHP